MIEESQILIVVKIQTGIFQGNLLLPLLSVIYSNDAIYLHCKEVHKGP